MTVNLTLIVLLAAFFAAGIYLLLERSLTRVLLGLILLGNGANILMLAMSGGSGRSPLYIPGTPAEDYADSLPQALILTAIVITFAVTAFMLGIIYRSWVLGREDDVQDDPEDRRVADQDSYDWEDDADVVAETSEFFDEDAPAERTGATAYDGAATREVRTARGDDDAAAGSRRQGDAL
ncbi:Na(+)/H(+) antiporter subunit C [Arthrobacter pityocampae]|uniref:Na(+)/H(+) antiporter subunit C n=1 Tax=Arthrobacter pityocampae TaxID=547334 RepID=A0A2S5IXD4_9MICC|nr:Na(+)/H(+) antiporter subunit C [Arthrobacter pityocampae]PPB49229.1 Na(+)/H(+) antiporter subunit C [Arthrobacter pityocampae]